MSVLSLSEGSSTNDKYLDSCYDHTLNAKNPIISICISHNFAKDEPEDHVTI